MSAICRDRKNFVLRCHLSSDSGCGRKINSSANLFIRLRFAAVFEAIFWFQFFILSIFIMSKVAKKLKTVVKKTIDKVNHGNRLETYIPAGMAVAGPPLGPQLGQVWEFWSNVVIPIKKIHILQKNINIAAFCKEFNEKTKDYKEGIPLPCRVTVNSDRSFDLIINQPPVTFFLKQAAGIQRAAMKPSKPFLLFVLTTSWFNIFLFSPRSCWQSHTQACLWDCCNQTTRSNIKIPFPWDNLQAGNWNCSNLWNQSSSQFRS